jgi:hypothetical protein
MKNFVSHPTETRLIGWSCEEVDKDGNMPSYVCFEQAGKLIMIFSTVRGGPNAALNTLSKKFPDLTFDLSTVYEDGQLFGITVYKNGITRSEVLEPIDPRCRLIAEGFADKTAGICYDERLVISGPNLNDFKQWLGEDPLSLKNILPIPDVLENLRIERHPLFPNPNPDIRKWCIEHWGTPLDIEPLDYILDDEYESPDVSMIFDTFWAPPIPAIKILSQRFPALKFVLTYVRRNSDAGIITFRKGKSSGIQGDTSQSIYHHVVSNMYGPFERIEEAEYIAKTEEDIEVGEDFFPDTAMQIISRHKGHLNLCCLAVLSDEGAAALSEHDGSLSFDGLSFLTDNAAMALARHKGDLFLNRITVLSDRAAQSLAQHDGALSLNGLTGLSDVAALAFSKHKGALHLDGLAALSDAAAMRLAQHRGCLHFESLTDLSSAAAKNLLKHGQIICKIDLHKIAAGKESGAQGTE